MEGVVVGWVQGDLELPCEGLVWGHSHLSLCSVSPNTVTRGWRCPCSLWGPLGRGLNG